MIRNFEIAVLKPNEICVAEDFNLEFSALAYYYSRLKKLKTQDFSFIKIWIENNSGDLKLNYGIHQRILFIETKFDFSTYLVLEKMKS